MDRQSGSEATMKALGTFCLLIAAVPIVGFFVLGIIESQDYVIPRWVETTWGLSLPLLFIFGILGLWLLGELS